MLGKGIISSLWVTLEHIFRKKVTLRYPKQRQAMVQRFFGLQRLTRDVNGREKCTACGICATNCPVHCITIVKGKREDDGKPYPVEYTIGVQQCIFCGICVEVCPFDALHVGHRYELAGYSREDGFYQKVDLLIPVGGAK